MRKMTEGMRLCSLWKQSDSPDLPGSGSQILPFKVYLFVLLLLVAATNVFAQKHPSVPADYVNPFIGTAPPEEKQFLGNNPPPGEELYYGCVSPAAMTVDPVVKLGPNTGFDGIFHVRGSSYRYTDTSIMGFTHLQHEYNLNANILFMPTVGSVQTAPGSRENPESGYRSSKDYKREKASAGYYTVFLTRYGINVELTASKNCGFHRYRFPGSSQSNVLIDLSIAQTSNPVQNASLQVVDAAHVSGWQQCKGFTVYFYAEFSQPFASYGTWKEGVISPESSSGSGKNIGVYLNFDTWKQGEVLSKVGISLVSQEEAKKNLEQEIPDWNFDQVHQKAFDSWNEVLKRFRIEGGTRGDRINFYTSVYRVVEYGDFLGWPRAQTIMILARGSRWISSQLSQMAWVPGKGNFWGLGQASGVAGIYARGFHDFPVASAYEALRKGATETWEAVAPYRKYGFIPFTKPSIDQPTSDSGRTPGADCVNRTLGYAYEDYCIARLAKALGKEDDYAYFFGCAKNYQNLFDPTTGFMRAKRPDSSWVTPFDPGLTYAQFFYREGTAWHYLWLVLHDIPDLVQRMGGKSAFEHKLDELFTRPYSPPARPLRDITGIIGQYCHGNETDRYVPYLYNYAGAPWKAQRMVRTLMTLLHHPTPSGLCGMDDNGYLTGWYAQSALGFYAVNPASGYYDIGSPLFKKVSIRLDGPEGGEFIIQANNASPRNIYVQSVSLNGKTLDRPLFHYSDIKPGGKLLFEMGPEPNKKWGAQWNLTEPK
jgi:putative alpha-1,2-mannosidase